MDYIYLVDYIFDMYARKFYRRRPRKYLRKGKSTRRGRGGVSQRIKKYVKREIHRNIENKEIFSYSSNQTITTATAGVNMYNIPLIVPVSQGTSNTGRIGDAIRVRKGIVSGTVHLKPYDATNNPGPFPMYVKMFLIRDLTVQGQRTGLSAGDTDYFFKGNGANLAPQGNLLDLDLDINKEKFRLLATKTVRLGSSGYTTLGPTGIGSWLDNSTITARFSFNWGKYTKKMLKFSEESSYCSNDNVYLMWQAVYADGKESDGYQIIQTSYVNKMGFEDA